MSDRIELDIAADTRAAVRSVDNLGTALDRVADDLEDVDRAGQDTERSLIRAFRRIAREADDSADKIERDFTGAFDEVKQEAGSSGREAAASFGGGFEDVADFVQETLANALGGFGPAGAAAGIALAAVLGSVLSSATLTQERIQEARERAADLASTMYENAGKLPLQDRVEDLLEVLTQERRPTGLVQGLIDQWVDFGDRLSSVRRTAEQTRRPVDDLVRALTGSDLAASRETLRRVNEELERLRVGASLTYAPELEPLEDYARQLETVIQQTEFAAAANAAVSSALNYRQKIDEIAEAWQTAAGSAGDYITETEDGPEFDVDDYLRSAEREIDAANKIKGKLVGLPDDIRREATNVYKSQGAAAANAYVDAYTSASAANKVRFNNAARQSGESAGAAQGKAFTDAAEAAARARAQGMGPIPLHAKIATIDDSAVRNYRRTVTLDGRIVVSGRVRGLAQEV